MNIPADLSKHQVGGGGFYIIGISFITFSVYFFRLKCISTGLWSL